MIISRVLNVSPVENGGLYKAKSKARQAIVHVFSAFSLNVLKHKTYCWEVFFFLSGLQLDVEEEFISGELPRQMLRMGASVVKPKSEGRYQQQKQCAS